LKIDEARPQKPRRDFSDNRNRRDFRDNRKRF